MRGPYAARLAGAVRGYRVIAMAVVCGLVTAVIAQTAHLHLGYAPAHVAV